MESGDIEQVIDWNDPAINWEGRGGDRGLRGIAFHRDRVYIAASDEIFVYDRQFNSLESYRNQYLKHCHEISVAGNTLFLTSTNINGILEFDLALKQFIRGYIITARRAGLLRRFRGAFPSARTFRATGFDPNDPDAGVVAGDELHINNITRRDDTVMIAGTRTEVLLGLQAGTLRNYAPLPIGTHNAAAYRDGLLYNDTRSNRIVIADSQGRVKQSFSLPELDDVPTTQIPRDHARPGFARGLCTWGDDFIIGGSSPSTISVYNIRSGERIRSVNISRDVRNCIHGLELWPENE